MERQDQEHRNLLSRKEHEEKIVQSMKNHDEELRYLEKLKTMGVDLTKFMVSQFQTPEKLIQIQSGDEKQKAKLVFHSN